MKRENLSSPVSVKQIEFIATKIFKNFPQRSVTQIVSLVKFITFMYKLHQSTQTLSENEENSSQLIL